MNSVSFSNPRPRRPSTAPVCGLLLLMLLFLMEHRALGELPQVTTITPQGVQRGVATEVVPVGKIGSKPVHVWCSHPGVNTALNDKGDKLVITPAEGVPPGRHWLRFANAEGATTLLPFIVGLLEEVAEVEPNNDLKTAQEISGAGGVKHGIVVNGVLHKNGEVDTFAVTLAAGETLVVSLAAHEALGSPMDGVLQLVSAQGRVLLQNDDHHGNDPQIVYTATEAGPFFVRVFAFPSTPNSTINFAGSADSRYRLTLTTGPFVDHIFPLPSSNAIEGTSVVESDIDGESTASKSLADEFQWLAFGDNLDAVGESAPHQSKGRLVTTRLLKSLPGHHTDRLTRPDTFNALSAETADSAPADGTIRLNLWETILQPEAAATSQFEAKKGESLRVVVQAKSRGAALDPVVRVLGPDGATLKEQDDISRENRDVDFVWKATADGTFIVEVTDRFGHFGPRYFYHALVMVDQPRVTATVETDRFALSREKGLDIPVTITRTSGYDRPLKVDLDGSPAGLEVTPCLSEAKGDSSKKVTLKIKMGTAIEHSGPIRIRLTETSPQKEQSFDQNHYATAPLPVSEGRTQLIWLTIPPPPAEQSKK